MDQQTAIEELKRVASALNTRTLSRSAFAKHGNISAAGVESAFGSWNEAIVAAGLIPVPPGGLPKADHRRIERLAKQITPGAAESSTKHFTDMELLQDLLRLAKELKRRPSANQIAAKGKFSRDIYQKRWGTVARAYEAALAMQSED